MKAIASTALQITAAISVCFFYSQPSWAQQTYGPTASGDGAYSIAYKSREPGSELSISQWVNAIYALNPHAFSGGVNTLKMGVMLRLPSAEQVRQHADTGALAISNPTPVMRTPPPQASGAGEKSLSQESTYVPDPNRSDLFNAESAVPVPPPAFISGPAPGTIGAMADGAKPELEESTPAKLPQMSLAQGAKLGGMAESSAAESSIPAQAKDSSDKLLELDDGGTERAQFANTALHAEAMQAVGTPGIVDVLPKLQVAETQFSGDLEFDYIYGVVLLDTGNAEEALFPLLRASRAQPNSLGIRLDLGRAYFNIGENESARVIFHELQAQSPPPKAAQVIESYIAAIDRKAARYESHLLARLSAETGFDSNANSASDLLQFAGFLLDSRARSKESAYGGLGALGDYAMPVSTRLRWLIGANLRAREYTDANELSSVLLGLSTGASYRYGDWELSARLRAAQSRIDGEVNNDELSLTGGWNWRASTFWAYRMGLKLATVRYDDVLSNRDVDQFLITGGLTRQFNFAYGSQLSIDVIGGLDDAVNMTSPNSRDLLGVGIGGLVRMTPRMGLDLVTRYMHSSYEGSFFGQDRSDSQLTAGFGLRLTDNRLPHWSLQLTGHYIDNSSEITLFEYERFDIGLIISRIWD